MQIQIHTDHNIQGREALAEHVKGLVAVATDRFHERITRVEVHLSDQNGDRNGQSDKRCVMEARLEGRKPTAVTHDAATVTQAVEGAVHKLTRSLESVMARLHEHRP